MKDETKGKPIGESVCLKPKMYSVLPAGHDPKTPETDVDFEKELEKEEYRKSQGEKKWEKKRVRHRPRRTFFEYLPWPLLGHLQEAVPL